MWKGVDRAIIATMLTLLIVSFIVYKVSTEIEKKYEDKAVEDMVMMIGSFFENIEREIFRIVGDNDIVIYLYENDEARKHIEAMMSVLVTPEVHYVYALYIDEKGRFRFLIDASKEDKALLGEKFDVIFEDKWWEAVKRQKPTVIVHENPIAVGATYIKPVVQKGETKLLLVADFAVEEIKEIRGYFGAIRTFSQASAFVAMLLLYVVFIQYYRRKKLEARIYRDPLTGLYNRSFLEKELSKMHIGSFYLVLIDIDNFRKINSTYGERVGDEILKKIGKFLESEFKSSTVVRYAGEEFLILIPKYTYPSKEKLIEHLESVRKKLKEIKVKIGNQEISVTASFGVNVSTERERSLEEALRNADRALYRAKKFGKDRIEVFDIEKEEKEIHLSVSEVISAIDEGRLTCFYQGIYRIDTREAVYYEALARIRSKDGRIFSPGSFLDEIRGTFAYMKFVKEILSINTNLLREIANLKVSINLTPSDLLDSGIVDLLMSIEENLSSRIYLEITEAEGIPSFEKIGKVVEDLRKKGFKVGIDDFGAGYSNLINLTKMKIDFLKIDGSLIVDLHRSRATYMLVKAITDFCKKMEIKVVAEFVETEETVKKLKELGIEYAQGYLFDKPKPIENLRS